MRVKVLSVEFDWPKPCLQQTALRGAAEAPEHYAHFHTVIVIYASHLKLRLVGEVRILILSESENSKPGMILRSSS